MPKPTIFSASIEGQERLLFLIQERASGDLTIIVKHSLFEVRDEEFAAPKLTDDKRLIEERISIHRSLNSRTVNVIKYTKVRKDGNRFIVRNHTKALKLYNQFCGIFARRAGDMSDSRYIVPSSKGEIISIGPYHPVYFQPVLLVMVSPKDREFICPLSANINVIQKPFSFFRITILWQFLAFAGDNTMRTVVAASFSDDEIDVARNLGYNPEMVHGVDESGAIQEFHDIKNYLAKLIIRSTWLALSDEQRQYVKHVYKGVTELDLFLNNGLAHTPEHRALMSDILAHER